MTLLKSSSRARSEEEKLRGRLGEDEGNRSRLREDERSMYSSEAGDNWTCHCTQLK